jgi:hypothetical protein
VGAPISVGANAYELYNGDIGWGRFGYRTGGTALSIYATVQTGVIPGLIVGGSVWGGEKSYDGASWFFDQFTKAIGQINYGLNNGWVPGR